MAVDKAVDSAVLDGYFDNIADSIRAKAGTQSTYTPAQMSTAIDNIPSSDLSEYFGDEIEGSWNSIPAPWVYLIKKIPGEISVKSGTSRGLRNAFAYWGGTSIPKIVNTSRTDNLVNTFMQATNLTSLDLSSWDVSNVTSINQMCSGCSSLTSINLSNWNTNSLTDMGSAFSNCAILTSIDLSSFNTSNVTDIGQLFGWCNALANITWGNNFNTSNVTTMNRMFAYCRGLVTLDISFFDMGKTKNVQDMFASTSNLENLTFGYDLGKGYITTQSANYTQYTLDLSFCTKLTHTSLMSVINNLYDIATAGCNTQQLVLGSTNLAKLTSAEIAIATNKGWTVS